MSTNIKNPTDIQLLATYGTLRDDNDSYAPWAKDFTKNISHAVTGKLAEYRLYGHPKMNYPFAVHTGDPNDTIVVRLLSWPSKEEFAEKIIQADMIEGDEYERKIVEVSVKDNGIKYAYVYVSKLKISDKTWTKIPSGDWLQRHFK
ncbi:hypothetical protein I4U23_013379 [Adineta vaga]|nr:hypothetical protein I4U23_013379 [Adineta vaga]